MTCSTKTVGYPEQTAQQAVGVWVPGVATSCVQSVTVRVLEPQKDVALKISKYNLLAVPVLETDGRVVGFVRWMTYRCQ